MPCLGPSADEIASETVRNNKQVHSLLRRLCGKVPPSYILHVPNLQLWWNAGHPEPAHKYTLDHHTKMLYRLCEMVDVGSWNNIINRTIGLRAWWTERERLDTERRNREKLEFGRTQAADAIKEALEKAGRNATEL